MDDNCNKNGNLRDPRIRRIVDRLRRVDQIAATDDLTAVLEMIEDIYRQFDLRPPLSE